VSRFGRAVTSNREVATIVVGAGCLFRDFSQSPGECQLNALK
jgi:hypothetical protein